MPITDPSVKMLAESIALALGIPYAQIEREIDARRAQAARRAARQNQRFAAALDSATPAQEVRRWELERDGYRVTVVRVNKRSGNVALVMQKDAVWSSRRQRVAPCLAVVYPDGSMTKTDERSVSIRSDF